MYKKSFYLFILLLLISVTSCTNILQKSYGSRDFSFQLGQTAAAKIASTITQNNDINDNTELTVVSYLLRGETVQSDHKITTVLSDLYKTSFTLPNVPFGNNYFMALEILYKDIVIYNGISNLIVLNEKQDSVDINISLNQHNSRIRVELNGGTLDKNEIMPTEYFINSNINLPIPKKENCNFDGWYISRDFNGSQITELGKNNFIGDVTLYAKWIDIKKVSSVTFSPNNNKIDFGDDIILNTPTGGATIYYTADGSEPDFNSPVFTSLKVTEDIINESNDEITIKAFAAKDGLITSDISEMKYTLKRYTVNFNNNSYGTSQNPVTDLKKGDVIKLPELDEADFAFDGWFDGASKVHDDTFNYTVNKTVTLTASWREINGVAKVSFGTSQIPDAMNSLDNKETISLSCDTAGADIWYTLDNSNPKTSSQRIKYEQGKPIIIENDINIRAVAQKTGRTDSQETQASYKVRKYNITFVENSHGEKPETQVLRKYDVITNPNIKQTGYIFEGWFTDSGFSNSPWDFEADKVQTNDITLYAKWSPITYTVTFDRNGGTGDVPENIQCTYDVEFTLPSYNLTRSGFNTQDKWGMNSDGTENSYEAGKGINIKNLTDVNKSTVTLYAQWTDLKPDAVTDVTSSPENGAITISWKNPSQEDIDSVIITCDNGITVPPVPVKGKAGQVSSYRIPCPNGKIYNFEIKVLDEKDPSIMESDAVQCKQNLYVLTENPEILTDYTSQNDPGPQRGIPTGEDGNWAYAKFGDWPQTWLPDDKVADIIKDLNTININGTNGIDGWQCYCGTDGYYYVKVKATPYDPNIVFDNTQINIENKEYYFRLEPIYWRILTNDFIDGENKHSGRFLFAEKALTSQIYSNTSCRYDTSDIRQYINNEFLNKAFSAKARDKINITNVDNGSDSTTTMPQDPPNENACSNTNDKIFLLSVGEISDSDKYGFSSGRPIIRMRYATDFAKATGTEVGLNFGTQYWLRSPGSTTQKQEVKYIDEFDLTNIETTYSLAVVPGLTISF